MFFYFKHILRLNSKFPKQLNIGLVIETRGSARKANRLITESPSEPPSELISPADLPSERCEPITFCRRWISSQLSA